MKKQILGVLLALTLLLGCVTLSGTAFAATGDTFTVDGITYKILSTDSIAVTHSGTALGTYSGNITIPANVEYQGVAYNVTKIDSDAFAKCANLAGINIPDSILDIGSYAFSNCTNLTDINLPNSITTIQESAFRGCSSLRSIIIPEHILSIQPHLFENCINLEFVTLPENLLGISNYSFSNCKNLTSINIPSNIISIGEAAFWGCPKLTSFIIPNKVTVINDDVFGNCTNLSFVSIPNGVNAIGNSAFMKCTNLASISIPDSVTTIDAYAFDNCINLTSIDLPNSISTIGSGAFTYCTGLSTITLPDNLTSISSYTFQDCINLKTAYIPESVTSIDTEAFIDCTNLTDIYFNGLRAQWNLVVLGESAIPEGVTIHCLDDEEIEIPNTPNILKPVISSVTNETDGILVSWTKPLLIEGEKEGLADGYEVLRKTADSDYEIIYRLDLNGDTSAGFSYTDINVEPGITYIYTVRAFAGDNLGTYYEGVSIIRSLLSIDTLYVLNADGLFPLNTVANIDLCLNEPLPKKYYEEINNEYNQARYLGKAQLLWKNQILLTITDIIYTNNMTDSILTLNITAQADSLNIPPNETLTVRLLAPDENILDTAICKTSFQRWQLLNYAENTPKEWLYEIYGKSKGNQILKKWPQPGSGGVCFGMATSVSLINNDDIDIELFQDVAILDEANRTTKINSSFADTADELIQKCNLLQKKDSVQEQLENHKHDYEGLLRATKAYLGESTVTTNSMPIVWINDDNNTHALAVYNYNLPENGNDLLLKVYDCNVPYSTENLIIKNFASDKNVLWTFKPGGYNDITSTSSKFLTYYVPSGTANILGDTIKHSLLTLKTSPLYNAALNELGNRGADVIPILPSCEASGTETVATQDDYAQVWISGKDTFTLEGQDAFTITDDFASYTMSAQSSSFTFSTTDQKTIEQTAVTGDDVSISCDYITEDDTVVTVHYEGTADKPVILQKTDDDKVIIKNANDGKVTITYDKNNDGTVEESYTHDITKQDGNNLQITADGDNKPSYKNPSSGGSSGGSSSSGSSSGSSSAGNTVNNKPSVTAPDNAMLFLDVPDTAYYYNPVLWALEHNITSGVSADKFAPEQTCTRGQVVSFLWRAMGRPEPTCTANPFSDVTTADYFYKPVLWAYENNITSGISADKFAPEQTCTRGQVVSFLYRCLVKQI